MITAAALQLNAVTDSKGYDGSASSSATPVTVGTLFGGDTVSGRTQAFGSKNVLGGNGSTLTVTGYTVNDGNSGANYSVTSASALGTITAAALQVNAVTDSKGYDGSASSSATPVTVGTLFGGDTVSGRTQAFGSKNELGATRSTLTETGYTEDDGNSGANYSVTSASALGTITAAALQVNAVTDSKGYDGSASSSATPVTGSEERRGGKESGGRRAGGRRNRQGAKGSRR